MAKVAPDKNLSRDWSALLTYGELRPRQWLLEQGVSRHSLDNALKSGKLIPLARGVVARPGMPMSWHGVVASLERVTSEPVYVGGLSALSQAGLGHYLDLAGTVHLYSSAPRPAWLERLGLGTTFIWHRTTRLWPRDDSLIATSLRALSENHPACRMATPEQAFLEVLMDVPDAVSFEHADNLMQSLSALSPRRLDGLLRACRHVQVKRLFFFFADRYNYPWRKRLKPEDYHLGSGKRLVVAGGKLDKKYLITVPESFHGSE